MIGHQERNLEGFRILVVDDEEMLRKSILAELEDLGADVFSAGTLEDARKILNEIEPDLSVCDIRLPDGNGIDLAKELKERFPTSSVILISAHGGMDTAIEAVRLNAFDYLRKPFHIGELTAVVMRACEVTGLRKSLRFFETTKVSEASQPMIGQSPPMAELRQKIQKLTQVDVPAVLIQGETGTGKELVASMLHRESRRAKEPFIEVNCASLPASLIESELFGYEKGAFTDAKSRKLGLFEIAKSGTVFLDEIGELPLSLQAKLLRVLEQRKFRRLGGMHDISVQAKIIAATNRDLAAMCSKGDFRSDLFFRLSVVSITIPPLRQRGSDLRDIFDYFVSSISTELGLRKPKISKEVYALLESMPWNGNVRELKNVVYKSLVFLDRLVLKREDLAIDCSIVVDDKKITHAGEFLLPEKGVDLEKLERSLIVQALEKARGNKTAGAKLLGLTRHTMRYRMEKFGLT